MKRSGGQKIRRLIRSRPGRWAATVGTVMAVAVPTGPPAWAAAEPTPPTTPTTVAVKAPDTDDAPAPAVPPAEDLYSGTDPSRNLQRHNPFKIVEYPYPNPPEARGIRLLPKYIDLVQGGKLVRRIPFNATQRVTFEAVAAAVKDGTWITPVQPGIFGLRAAFVQGPGTNVVFKPPGVTELRLSTDPAGVFIGGRTAQARFEGVRVTSWDPVKRAPTDDVTLPRPFVAYEENSRLEIVHSEMAYLGSDRVGSYGVAWRLGGTTGEATDSVFHHNFFGIYTYEAKDIRFTGNVFRDNLYYGWDPHDFSTGLVAENNEAYRNGSHGFIVSKSVTDSLIKNNYSHDNAGNGIVIDSASERNVVSGNRVVNNAGDGIVLLGSSNNTVEDNDVSGNRIGVRANLKSANNMVVKNRLHDNHIGVQAYNGATQLNLVDNIVTANAQAGMVLDAAGSVVKGGNVAGGNRGIEARAPAKVTGVTFADVFDGVVIRSGANATLENLTIRAKRNGVRVEKGGAVALANSYVNAPRPTRGDVPPGVGNRMFAPASPETQKAPWLAIAGVIAIVCAIVLEFLAFTRDRRRTRRVLRTSTT